MLNLFNDNENVFEKLKLINRYIKDNNKENNNIVIKYIKMYPKNINYNENIFLKNACKSNNIDVVQAICKINNTDINSSNGKPLVIASQYKSEEVLEFLLSQEEINVSERNYLAFREAIKQKNSKIIHMFEQYFENVEISKLNIKLILLCFLQHEMISYFKKYLKKYEADINEDNGIYLRNVCKRYIYNKKVYKEFLDYFLTFSNINPNLREGDSVIIACENNSIELLHILKKFKNIDFNSRQSKAMRISIKRNNKEIFDFLLKEIDKIEQPAATIKLAIEKGNLYFTDELLKEKSIINSLSKDSVSKINLKEERTIYKINNIIKLLNF
jgi:hypothetical protein